MPTYAYACKDCGHEFDIVQSFSDDSLTDCPECEGTLRKKFNSVGVVFKGSGFYRNDSRSDGSGSKSGASTAASSNGSNGSSGSKGSDSNGSSAGSTGSEGAGSSSTADKKSGAAASASSGSAAAKTPATASA